MEPLGGADQALLDYLVQRAIESCAGATVLAGGTCGIAMNPPASTRTSTTAS